MASLIDNLGGPYGFGYDNLGRTDDDSLWLDISSVFPNGLNFFGTRWDHLYINNNGSISFGDAVYGFTPDAIGADFQVPIIAPFWADVDTRGYVYETQYGDTFVYTTPGGNSAGTNLTWYEIDPYSGTITVTWDDVGFFNSNTDWLNAFQLQLQSTGGGNFDITFIYEDINWESGDASGGVQGIGGDSARAGFSAGDGVNYYEFHFSGDPAFMLDLENTYLAGANEPGKWEFSVRNGSVSGIGREGRDDIIEGSYSDDILDGRSGNDILFGGFGNDTLAGDEGDDQLFGEEGDDQLIGGDGNNYLDGGSGVNSALYSGIRNTLDISRTAEGNYRVSGEDFEDLLLNIDFIEFDDGRMSIDYAVQVRESQEEFSRFYMALFDRIPDTMGLTYWVNDLAAGNTIQNAAQAFTESAEFTRLYGPDVNNRDFVNLLYQNILGRDADDRGYDYWLQEISATGNRGGMIVSFANSEEYIDLTSGRVENFLSGVPLDGYTLI